jgi:lipoprotein NlpD
VVSRPAPVPDTVSPPIPPPEEEVSPADTTLDISGVFHIVQPGQTVWRIAKTYGVSLELLADINDLEDPTVIETGQRLFVPGADHLLDVPVYQPEERPALERTGDIDLQWPLTGTITSRFGGRRRHTGLDIAAPRNTPVLAAADGEVTYSGSGLRGYGNLVVIDHGQGVVTLYAHNRRNLVRKGQRVKRGERVARVGSTGHSTGPHVHFEVQIDGKRVNPRNYLD